MRDFLGGLVRKMNLKKVVVKVMKFIKEPITKKNKTNHWLTCWDFGGGWRKFYKI